MILSVPSYVIPGTYGQNVEFLADRNEIQAIELTRDLSERYILHPPSGDLEDFQKMVAGWQNRYAPVFLIENLIAGDFSPVAEMPGSFPLCCDTGHLLRSGSSSVGFLRRFASRIQEIHLHGVMDGGDHRAFSGEEPWFREILPFLKAFEGVLNLEVFSIPEVNKLIAVLSEAGVL